MYPKLSGVSRVDGVYGVYVDIINFILWVHLHCYDLSPLLIAF